MKYIAICYSNTLEIANLIARYEIYYYKCYIFLQIATPLPDLCLYFHLFQLIFSITTIDITTLRSQILSLTFDFYDRDGSGGPPGVASVTHIHASVTDLSVGHLQHTAVNLHTAPELRVHLRVRECY